MHAHLSSLSCLGQQTFASELMLCLRTGAGSDAASASQQRMEQLVEGHVRLRLACSMMVMRAGQDAVVQLGRGCHGHA